MYIDETMTGHLDEAVSGGAVDIRRDVPASIFEHLLTEHTRDPLDLVRSSECLVALHRFEHFEAAQGLLIVGHVHWPVSFRAPKPRENGP